MNLSHEQITDLSKCMREVSVNAKEQAAITDQSIRGTNRVITVFTLLGALLAILIFVLFVKLTAAVNQSIVGMQKIEGQVIDLNKSIHGIASSSNGMTDSLGAVVDISHDMGEISDKTLLLNRYLSDVNVQTRQISLDSGYIRFHTSQMNQNFSKINQSIGNISHSLHESAKPIRQFVPIP